MSLILEYYLVVALIATTFALFTYTDPKEDFIPNGLKALQFGFLWPVILGILGFRWANDRGWTDAAKNHIDQLLNKKPVEKPDA
jgi:hypothetical protein